MGRLCWSAPFYSLLDSLTPISNTTGRSPTPPTHVNLLPKARPVERERSRDAERPDGTDDVRGQEVQREVDGLMRGEDDSAIVFCSQR